jgi:hypothetical protein
MLEALSLTAFVGLELSAQPLIPAWRSLILAFQNSPTSTEQSVPTVV